MVAIAQKMVETVSKNRAGWPQLGKNLCGFSEGKYCLPNLLEIYKDVSMHKKKITLQTLFKNQDCKRQENISSWNGRLVKVRKQKVGLTATFQDVEESSVVPRGSMPAQFLPDIFFPKTSEEKSLWMWNL